MKIGLYGGLANNMYVFAKAMTNQGIEVCFIRDGRDRYPFSQPVWEDVAFMLDYDRLYSAEHWTWEQWSKSESMLGWRSPDWLADPSKEEGNQYLNTRVNMRITERAMFRLWVLRCPHWQAVLHLMNGCDMLLVCGAEGAILASASGKPFVVWPHGGDIRTVAGLHVHTTHAGNPLKWAFYSIEVCLLRAAYRSALWIGTHSPTWGGQRFGDIGSRLKGCRLKKLPIPVPIRSRMSKESRVTLLTKLMKQMDLQAPLAEWVGFVPSRVDFFWKGQDLLFRSLSNVSKRENLHFIVSGWGDNYYDAKRMISPQQVTFLPYAVSKPILYEFFQAVDFVADQFIGGTYGSAALEAMSCGTPVLMWIDDDMFLKKGWEPPPVLSGRSERDIADVLQGIVSRKIDLEENSQAVHNWVRRVHSEEKVVPQLMSQLKDVLSGSL